MFRRLSSRTLILSTLPCLSLCLAGCIIIPPYGKASRSNSNDGTTVVMPAGAPSIARGFNGNTKEDAPNAHVGLDIVATSGTPVLAVAPGEVTAVTGDLLSGRRIVIDHGKDRFRHRLFNPLLSPRQSTCKDRRPGKTWSDYRSRGSHRLAGTLSPLALRIAPR